MMQTAFLLAMLAPGKVVSGQTFMAKEQAMPSASSKEDEGKCRMPDWMQQPLQVPSTFRDVTPYIQNDNFELLDPLEDREEFCTAFNSIDESDSCSENIGTTNGSVALNCPGYMLFGDYGANVTGFGGINSFGVVKVRAGAEVILYGTRNTARWDEASGTGDFWNSWFVDKAALTQPLVNFSTYSNDRAAICSAKDILVECTLQPGALIVVGSGGWRDTTGKTTGKESGCDNTVHGLSDLQVPPAKFLQYVFDVQTAAKHCFYYGLDSNDLWNSLAGNKTQFLMNGEYVSSNQ